MKIREANLYRGAMLIKFGATDIFASHAGVSVSTVNRILREGELTNERRAKWDSLLGISRQENAASVLVSYPVPEKRVPAVELKPGPGGLGT